MKNKKTMTIYGAGVNDDTAALQAYFNGTANLIHYDGSPFPGGGRVYLITESLKIHTDTNNADTADT